MTRETSRDVYHAVVEKMAPGLRKKICEVLLNSSIPMTTSEIARDLSKPRDHISPRMPELTCRDLVEEAGERQCQVTGQRKITFQLTGRPERPVLRPLKIRPARKDVEKELANAIELRGDLCDNFLRGAEHALKWVLGEGVQAPTRSYEKTPQ